MFSTNTVSPRLPARAAITGAWASVGNPGYGAVWTGPTPRRRPRDRSRTLSGSLHTWQPASLKIPVTALVVNRDGINAGLADTAAELAEKYRVTQVLRLPYDPLLASFMDEGETEMYNTDALDPLIDRLF